MKSGVESGQLNAQLWVDSRRAGLAEGRLRLAPPPDEATRSDLTNLPKPAVPRVDMG
jgi:hypothetical protein